MESQRKLGMPLLLLLSLQQKKRKATEETQRCRKDRTPHKIRITTYYTASYRVLSADTTARRPHADHTTLIINFLKL